MQFVSAVIFDMDGVLTDSEPLINSAAIAMFRENGVTVQPQDFVPFIGTGEERYIGGVAKKYKVSLNLDSAKQRIYEIYLGLVPKELQAFPDAVKLVQDCRRAGLKIAVASSADLIKIQANLDKIGLPAQAWDAVITGDSIQRKKPAPDIFLAAAAKLQVAPSQCVVIEDALNGIQAAKAAGMRCIAVAHTFPESQLTQADLVRKAIAQISLSDLTGSST